ncbi:hypothetical protein [Saccharospirillum salsuginis]|uniref:Uncharacterized protein n=1 Tax=Saccharospirillum salsuginis TaxID=418750 RepID=A0A918NAI4_9GAMM|nr:hypothetical protein [Saccharospirillum salsuginis]GGX53321.1 hypothetical protein GCM10007392_21030 [Saccharospirillum salsuginis]
MYWEIIELANGEIALRKADSDDEPLLTIKFSDEAKDRLQDQTVDVARAMISAGVQVATDIENMEEDEELEMEASESTIH